MSPGLSESPLETPEVFLNLLESLEVTQSPSWSLLEPPKKNNQIAKEITKYGFI